MKKKYRMGDEKTMPNNTDELELGRKREEQNRQRSRDDELERERTIDGEEIYVPEDNEVNIEEEENDPSLNDDMPDEYYEDMFEEDWKEIEAAEAAKKQKEERLNKIKAKRKERDKRLKAAKKAEARRKEAEKLAALRRQQTETIPEQVVSVSPASSVSAEHEAPTYIHTEPVVNTPHTDVGTPVEVERGSMKPHGVYAVQENPADTINYTPSVQRKEKDYISEERPIYSAPYQPEKVTPEPTPSYAPSESDKPHIEVYDTEYSKEHKRAMWENEQRQEAQRQSQVANNNGPVVPPVHESSTPTPNSSVNEYANLGQYSSPITEHKDRDLHNSIHDSVQAAEYSRAHRVEQAAINGIEIGTTKNDFVKEDRPNARGVSVEERPYYTEVGIPVSVATAASLAGSHAFSDYTQNVGSSGIGEIVKESGGSTVHKSASDYMLAAKTVLANYDKETAILNDKLTVSKAQLKSLKDRGGAANEIQVVRAEIKTNSDRLKAITADKTRVSDFMQNGARSMSHITKDDVMGTNYSRSHMADLRTGKQDPSKVAVGEVEGANKKLFYSSSNIKQIHKARVKYAVGVMGDRLWGGVKGGFKRVLRESDDLNEEVEVYDTTMDARRVLSAHIATIYMNRELKALGLGHDAIKQQLNEMGVIVGIGDVSKMSLKDIGNALGIGDISKMSLGEIHKALAKTGSTLPIETKRKVLEAIELKQRLHMNNFKLADIALKEAGEFARWSRKKIQSELRKTTDIAVKKQLEAALRYKKLSKWSKFAGNKWRITGGFFGGLTQRLLQKNEYLAEAVGLSQHAVTAYRMGRVVVKTAAKAATKTSNTGVKIAKTAKKTTIGLRNRAELFTKNKMLQTHGMRKANLIGKTKVSAIKKFGAKGGSKLAQSKFGQWASKALAGLKEGIVGAVKGIGAAIKGLAGLIAGAGSTLLFILIIFLIVGAIVCVIYFFILGDSSNGTSVPEMVQYLQDKNTSWLAEVDDKTKETPNTKDKSGNSLDEYTKITYSFFDSDGDRCLVTDNSKELISMSAVHFQQDYSDADKIYDYLDKMWTASHSLSTSETALYGCHGEICLNEDLTLNTEAQGFNGGTRTYSCTDRYDRILYPDCFSIDSETEYRSNLCNTWSHRFANSVASASKYSGISGIITQSMTTGYGCQTKTEKFYCTNIDNITNSEVLVKLVDKTGIPYATLKAYDGCKIKHSGTYEGAPRSGCKDYTETLVYYNLKFGSLPKDNNVYTFTWNSSTNAYEYTHTNGTTYSFYGNGQGEGKKFLNVDEIPVWYSESLGRHRFCISYFTCDEKTCNGHNIEYHYCPGDHKEIVCYGHTDLNVNMEIIAFDKIFGLVVENLPYHYTDMHGGEVDMSKLCTHNGYLPDGPDWTCSLCGMKYIHGVGLDDSNVLEENKNCQHEEIITFDANWSCARCGVKYIAGQGYDYSEADWQPITDENGNRIYNTNCWTPDEIEWCKAIYEQDWLQMYGVQIRSSLFYEADRILNEYSVERPNSLFIPLYNQGDWPNTPYGNYGTVASHGCGITCVAMLDSYYKDKATSPATLARIYGDYNTAEGSLWALFPDSAKELGIPYVGSTSSWADVMEALQNGQPVVSIQNGNGIFTSGGHFIILTGVTADGKVHVNDPNGGNWNKNQTMIDGFANGFTQQQIQIGSSGTYWIYGVKPGTETTEPTKPTT